MRRRSIIHRPQNSVLLCLRWTADREPWTRSDKRMFTGIVQEIGTVALVKRSHGLVRLTIDAPKTTARVQRLESVAVSGVCLSVIEVGRGTLSFEMIGETQRLTRLSGLREGDRVNLEPSLSISDRLGGQILFGHVDGTGTIVKRHQRSGELVLEIRVLPLLRKFLVAKGPIAVDGVSLTVGQTVRANSFTVHLIPETLRQTTLISLSIGDRVNIELDYIAKLVWNFLQRRGRSVL